MSLSDAKTKIVTDMLLNLELKYSISHRKEPILKAEKIKIEESNIIISDNILKSENIRISVYDENDLFICDLIRTNGEIKFYQYSIDRENNILKLNKALIGLNISILYIEEKECEIIEIKNN